jgi:AbrB family looped-hinge helix DNA binding protein
MKITSKGQLTIPIEIREALGLHPDTEVEFQVEGNAVKISKKTSNAASRGQRLVQKIRGRFAVNMTTEEIMKLTRQDDDAS